MFLGSCETCPSPWQRPDSKLSGPVMPGFAQLLRAARRKQKLRQPSLSSGRSQTGAGNMGGEYNGRCVKMGDSLIPVPPRRCRIDQAAGHPRFPRSGPHVVAHLVQNASQPYLPGPLQGSWRPAAFLGIHWAAPTRRNSTMNDPGGRVEEILNAPSARDCQDAAQWNATGRTEAMRRDSFS